MDDLKPLGLGELIDRSVSTFRTHWRELFLIFLPLEVPQFVGMTGWQLLVQQRYPGVRNPKLLAEVLSGPPARIVEQLVLPWALFGAVMLVVLYANALATVWTAHYVGPRALGRGSPTRAEAGRATLRQAGTIASSLALSLGWLAVACVVVCVPGAVLAGLGLLAKGDGPNLLTVILVLAALLLTSLGLLLTFLWYVVRFVAISPVLALEGPSAWKALWRSRDFVRGRLDAGFMGLAGARAATLLTLVLTAVSVVTFTAGIPTLIIQAVYGNLFSMGNATPEAIPPLLQVPAELFQYVVSAAVMPLYAVFETLYYVDVRVRREGLDLLQKLEAPAA